MSTTVQPACTQGDVRDAVNAAIEVFASWSGSDPEGDDEAAVGLLSFVLEGMREDPPVERLAALLVQREREWQMALRVPAPVRLTTAQHRRVHRLAARDGWACYLCHEPLADVCAHGGSLPLELHRWLAVVEHVVPKALGGTSAPANLRLACWPCNARKGSQ